MIAFDRFILNILRNNLFQASEGHSLPNLLEINLPFVVLILLTKRFYLLINYVRFKNH
jgi:hypothetical protein